MGTGPRPSGISNDSGFVSSSSGLDSTGLGNAGRHSSGGRTAGSTTERLTEATPVEAFLPEVQGVSVSDNNESTSATSGELGGGEGRLRCFARMHKDWRLYTVISILIIAVVVATIFAILRKPTAEGEKEILSGSTTTNPLGSINKFDAIKSLVAQTISDPATFVNADSAQTKAIQWLANEDDYCFPLTEQDRIIQRYILAVIYFSLSGKGWHQPHHFLSPVHECQWKSIHKEEGIIRGVSFCNNEFQIEILRLGKYY